jgi:meso-butanediol dehydrogenase / (S,S)-butanediol dehydrogenase / diacetyl reductase
VVNAAGIARRSTVDIADVGDWDDVMRVNVRGTFGVSKHAVPLLQKNGGSIVHIASIVGMMGVRNRSAYSASKGAVIALTRNMAMDYAHQKIRVNCVCPGFVHTPMTKALFEDPLRCAAITALHPLGRLGTPRDVSRAVLFLISEDASWITGQILAIDGGMTAGRADDI